MGNKDIFIELNVNISDLGPYYSQTGAATFYISSCTVAPHITYICLQKVWLKVNTKSQYL